MKSRIGILASLIFAYATLVGFINYQSGSKPWPVPDKYLKMENPVKSDAETLKEGKALYVKHCQSCHGKTGLGDGPKSSQLDTESGDFSAADFQKQKDGSLFYKISEGRDDMPSFSKKMPDSEEIWQVINYIRTFKK